ncbi:hypothetical protein DFH06DRAFT_1305938 [Mycena polygramma]|nr:hypothetical protein DFH06DRAFT_1305938 [Mycena polygramma]
MSVREQLAELSNNCVEIVGQMAPVTCVAAAVPQFENWGEPVKTDGRRLKWTTLRFFLEGLILRKLSRTPTSDRAANLRCSSPASIVDRVPEQRNFKRRPARAHRPERLKMDDGCWCRGMDTTAAPIRNPPRLECGAAIHETKPVDMPHASKNENGLRQAIPHPSQIGGGACGQLPAVRRASPSRAALNPARSGVCAPDISSRYHDAMYAPLRTPAATFPHADARKRGAARASRTPCHAASVTICAYGSAWRARASPPRPAGTHKDGMLSTLPASVHLCRKYKVIDLRVESSTSTACVALELPSRTRLQRAQERDGAGATCCLYSASPADSIGASAECRASTSPASSACVARVRIDTRPVPRSRSPAKPHAHDYTIRAARTHLPHDHSTLPHPLPRVRAGRPQDVAMRVPDNCDCGVHVTESALSIPAARAPLYAAARYSFFLAHAHVQACVRARRAASPPSPSPRTARAPHSSL